MYGQWLFVAIAGWEFGFGHLSRCLSLASEVRRCGAQPFFLVFGDDAAGARTEAAGFSCKVRPVPMMGAGFGELPGGDWQVAVVDLSHAAILANWAGASRFFSQVRRKSGTLAVIDNFGEGPQMRRMPDLAADVLIVPYVMEGAPLEGPWRMLSGAEYAVLSAPYVGLPARKVRARADGILVTCGGSDPNRLTVQILEELETIKSRLTVRTIVGPFFDKALANELAGRVGCSHHKSNLIEAPESLAAHMLWSDVTVAASGLVKYELAATSTPAVLISMDAGHDAANQPFVKKTTALDLGVNFDGGRLARAVDDLLSNHSLRAAMAAAGRRLVDGCGATRVIQEIRGTGSDAE